MLSEVAACSELGKREAENNDKLTNKNSWEKWAGEALLGGAGAAHRFTHVQKQWRPTLVSVDGCESNLPTNLLKAQALLWGSVWQSGRPQGQTPL